MGRQGHFCSLKTDREKGSEEGGLLDNLLFTPVKLLKLAF